MFIITLFAGYGMDKFGRKTMWMWCLVAAAVFTGLTYFVQNYWQLAVVRALASGFAASELAISVTLVNEQVPSRHRGLLYSIVQGGWPLGVFLASGVYLLFHQMGWRTVFLFGVIPIISVIIGRFWVKESPRFLHLQAVRHAKAAGAQAGRLLLICGGVGYLFYILGGALGEGWGRRQVLVWTRLATGPLNLIFMLTHHALAIWIIYFLIYQATNGTWSGAGYAYWAECFPTRVRGSAIGWLGAMFALGLIIGTALWTILISVTSPEVTWFIIAVVLGSGQWTALLLPEIEPGQQLEAVAV